MKLTDIVDDFFLLSPSFVNKDVTFGFPFLISKDDCWDQGSDSNLSGISTEKYIFIILLSSIS